MNVLALNAGSSTLKFASYDLTTKSVLVRGIVDRLGGADAVLRREGSERSVGRVSYLNAVQLVLQEVGPVEAVGCRVVHGGDRFEGSTIVNASVLEEIRKLAPLAPLHNSRDLEVLEAVSDQLPSVPQVAVFDTTFHRTLPPLAYRYAVPKFVEDQLHVRRYGFHGISYQYVANEIARVRGSETGRIVACHLGSGASVCALKDGKSVETSMGMTPLEGLIMGTRSGDIDPGAVLYLLRETGMTVQEADQLLNSKSGLLGLSGGSADVRVLENAAKAGDLAAEFALESFAYRVAKYVGSYVVVLGGLDALVFSGGVGEHSDDMRQRICGRLKVFGVDHVESIQTADGITCLSGDHQPSVWIVPTDEERQIANETLTVVSASSL